MCPNTIRRGSSRWSTRSCWRPGRSASGCWCIGAAGCLARRLHGRQQEGNQDGDDRNHDQELDQSETTDETGRRSRDHDFGLLDLRDRAGLMGQREIRLNQGHALSVVDGPFTGRPPAVISGPGKRLDSGPGPSGTWIDRRTRYPRWRRPVARSAAASAPWSRRTGRRTEGAGT